MYGFFQCSNCRSKWESGKVYKNRANNLYYCQECKSCNIMCQPYRVEETTCSMCGQVARSCGCDRTRHTDPKKPHRRDLCEKCRSGNMCQ